MAHTEKNEAIISVIISTLDRSESLSKTIETTLASFSFAQYERGEIVIVDNGSTDNTSTVVQEWAKKSPIPIQYIFEKKKGLSAARNAGIRSSKGEVLVFTDDDCRMTASYISEVIKYHSNDNGKDVMRSGSVELGDQSDLPLTIKPVKEKRVWKRPMSPSDEAQLLGKALIGCNIVTTRDVANKIGDFDEMLGAGTPCKASEDTDYFYRAYLENVELEIVPDLVIYHFHGRKLKEEAFSLHRNYAIGNGALVIKWLFMYPRFSKHFLWGMRDAIQNWLCGGSHQSNFEFTKNDYLRFQIKGITIYSGMWLAKFLKARK